VSISDSMCQAGDAGCIRRYALSTIPCSFSAAFFRALRSISVVNSEITGVVSTGHNSVRCLLQF